MPNIIDRLRLAANILTNRIDIEPTELPSDEIVNETSAEEDQPASLSADLPFQYEPLGEEVPQETSEQDQAQEISMANFLPIVKEAPYDFFVRNLNRYQGKNHEYKVYANKGFLSNPTVYAAIMFKVRAVTQAPLYAHMNDDDNPTRLASDHPMQLLMMRPNEHMSGNDLQVIRTIMYNLVGNSYIYIDRDPTGMPRALYPLRPDRVYEVIDPPRTINYAYVPLHHGIDAAVPILREDMIHDRHFTPEDDYEGFGPGDSPLRSVMMPIDIDNQFTMFLKQMVEGGVMPLGMLSTESYLSPTEADQARHRYRERYGGASKWSELLVLGRGLKYEKLGMTLEEMVFEKLDARNETRILAALGVSPLLVSTTVGLQSSTYTNQEKARQAFWEDVFSFELKQFSSNYNLRLDMGMQFRFMHDLSVVPALAGDIAAQSQTAERLFGIGVPLNLALKISGIDIPDIENGDVSMVHGHMVPLDKLINPPANEMGDMDAMPEDDMMALPPAALRDLMEIHAKSTKAMNGNFRKLESYCQNFTSGINQSSWAKYEIPLNHPAIAKVNNLIKIAYLGVVNDGKHFGKTDDTTSDTMHHAIDLLSAYLLGKSSDIFSDKNMSFISNKTRHKIQTLRETIEKGLISKQAQSILFVDADITLSDADVDAAINSIPNDSLLHSLLNASVQD